MNNPDPKTGSSTQNTKAASAEAADTLRETVHEAAGKVSSEVTGAADKVRGGAAQEIRQFADALQSAARELDEGSSQRRVFDGLASNVDHVAKAISDRNLGEMLNDLNDLARRNPMLFLGGAALAGFTATRLATASASGRSQTATGTGASKDTSATVGTEGGSAPDPTTQSGGM